MIFSFGDHVPVSLDPRTITVCIPTCDRPALLRAAVDSVLSQSYRHVIIAIGDDSAGSETLEVVRRIGVDARFPIRYTRNEPALGQNDNVDRLIQSVVSPRLVLLHDDDLLCPGSLAKLHEGGQRSSPVLLVFGKQQIISSAGVLDEAASIKLNNAFFRSSAYAGVQVSPLISALRQQIPNDGFLVDAEMAKAVGYRSSDEVGAYCDLDFNLRLATKMPPKSIVFVDSFTSQYRLSAASVSNAPASRRSEHPRAAVAIHHLLDSIPMSPEERAASGVLRRRLADKLIKGFALRKKRMDGLRVFFSDAYPLRKRLSRKGAYHLALIAMPKIDRLRRY